MRRRGRGLLASIGISNGWALEEVLWSECLLVGSVSAKQCDSLWLGALSSWESFATACGVCRRAAAPCLHSLFLFNPSPKTYHAVAAARGAVSAAKSAARARWCCTD